MLPDVGSRLDKVQDGCTRQLRALNQGFLAKNLVFVVTGGFGLWDFVMFFLVWANNYYVPSFLSASTLPAGSGIGLAVYTLMSGDWCVGIFLTAFSFVFASVTLTMELVLYGAAGVLAGPFDSSTLLDGSVGNYRVSSSITGQAQGMTTSRVVFLVLLDALVITGAAVSLFMWIATNPVFLSKPCVRVRYAPAWVVANDRSRNPQATAYDGPAMESLTACNPVARWSRLAEAVPCLVLFVKCLICAMILICGWIAAGVGAASYQSPSTTWQNAYESPFFTLQICAGALIGDFGPVGGDTSFYNGRRGVFYLWFWIALTFACFEAWFGLYLRSQIQHTNGAYTLERGYCDVACSCFASWTCYSDLWNAGAVFYQTTNIADLATSPKYEAVVSANSTNTASTFAANSVTLAVTEIVQVVGAGLLWIFYTTWVLILTCTVKQSIWRVRTRINKAWTENGPSVE